LIELSGWGRYPRFQTDARAIARPDDLPSIVAPLIGYVARGNGRAYGDAAIGAQTTLLTRRLDRMRSFDPATRQLVVEAGVLIGDIIATFAPRGFFPIVVPGTKLVTVGGAIAADVHGKNHHRDGGFGASVVAIKIVLPSGEVVTASRTENAALFHGTIGGMGLTGIILEATIVLRAIETGWIRQQTVVAENLDQAIAALDASDRFLYSVAWIDGLGNGSKLGRSLIYLGEHASRADLSAQPPFPPVRPARVSLPIDMPRMSLNWLSAKAFNELYFRTGARKSGSSHLVHWHPYFFPLDSIGGWNRIYGRHGFVQYQCVVPLKTAAAALGQILERTARRGDASFLAVLKKLGSGGGLMSFPMPGLTLALDFKMSPSLPAFLHEMDQLVIAAGGRIYLAKDAGQSRATFEAGYSALTAFRDLRHSLGAAPRIQSKLSNRLGV
jgi:FAD/FMN-containing dehydrogenase